MAVFVVADTPQALKGGTAILIAYKGISGQTHWIVSRGVWGSILPPSTEPSYYILWPFGTASDTISGMFYSDMCVYVCLCMCVSIHVHLCEHVYVCV